MNGELSMLTGDWEVVGPPPFCFEPVVLVGTPSDVISPLSSPFIGNSNNRSSLSSFLYSKSFWAGGTFFLLELFLFADPTSSILSNWSVTFSSSDMKFPICDNKFDTPSTLLFNTNCYWFIVISAFSVSFSSDSIAFGASTMPALSPSLISELK